MLTIAQAAELLGMPVKEVVDVAESPAGDLITTFDGTVLLNCIEPDAEGKTGLMFLAAPSETYGGSFPIYAQPGAVDRGPVPEDIDLATATARDVLAWVGDDADRAGDALVAENEREKPRKTVVAALEAILDEANADDNVDPDAAAGNESQE